MPRSVQAADERVEQLDLVVGERRGGLVHRDHPGVEAERLDDLDDLLLGHRQRARPAGRRGCRCTPSPASSSSVSRCIRPAVDQAAAARLAAEEDVLGDRCARAAG